MSHTLITIIILFWPIYKTLQVNVFFKKVPLKNTKYNLNTSLLPSNMKVLEHDQFLLIISDSLTKSVSDNVSDPINIDCV